MKSAATALGSRLSWGFSPQSPSLCREPRRVIAHNGSVKPALLLLAALSALLLACSGGSDDEASVPNADPATLLQRATAEVQQAGTFHFKLTHQNGSTPLPLNLELETAEGDFQVPGRLKADVKAEAAGSINVSVDVISIDDQTWITNPFTRGWQKLPGASLRDLADPGSLITAILPKVADPRFAGDESIGGVKTIRIEGTIDSGELRGALGFARPGHAVKIEAWIGAEDGLPRRIRLSGRLVSSEAENVQRQLDLSRFGETVDISPP